MELILIKNITSKVFRIYFRRNSNTAFYVQYLLYNTEH
jgi:hypothetical protein